MGANSRLGAYSNKYSSQRYSQISTCGHPEKTQDKIFVQLYTFLMQKCLNNNNNNKSSEGLYTDLGSSNAEGLGLNETLTENEMKLCHLTYHD